MTFTGKTGAGDFIELPRPSRCKPVGFRQLGAQNGNPPIRGNRLV